jgi:hypothetical protein
MLHISSYSTRMHVHLGNGATHEVTVHAASSQPPRLSKDALGAPVHT